MKKFESIYQSNNWNKITKSEAFTWKKSTCFYFTSFILGNSLEILMVFHWFRRPNLSFKASGSSVVIKGGNRLLRNIPVWKLRRFLFHYINAYNIDFRRSFNIDLALSAIKKMLLSTFQRTSLPFSLIFSFLRKSYREWPRQGSFHNFSLNIDENLLKVFFHSFKWNAVSNFPNDDVQTTHFFPSFVLFQLFNKITKKNVNKTRGRWMSATNERR